MDVYRTEEEQIEAIKRWWNENGKLLVSAIAIALATWLGWDLWQERQQTTAAQASDVYHDMVEAMQLVSTAEGEEKTKKETTARHLAEQLKTEFSRSTYAQYAALFLAKQAVDNSALENAAEELNWVLDQDASEPVSLVATLRLARVLLAQGKTEEALALIETADAGTMQSRFEEVKGDIYITLGRVDDARQAYNKAKSLRPFSPGMGRMQGSVLDMKVNDLVEWAEGENNTSSTSTDSTASIESTANE